jgi:hypothetical protein
MLLRGGCPTEECACEGAYLSYVQSGQEIPRLGVVGVTARKHSLTPMGLSRAGLVRQPTNAYNQRRHMANGPPRLSLPIH